MTVQFQPDYDPHLTGDIADACFEAKSRGFSDHLVCEQALLGLVWWMLFSIGEEATADMLRATLKFLEDGNFAAMWEDISAIQNGPPS